MPRNANTGVYTPPSNSWNPAQPDTVISSADWNAMRADMATALNHAPSTTRALHPTTGQVQDGAFIWGGTAGGTANALTLTLSPPITAYVAGMTLRFRASANNTSATPTLSVNGLPSATIVRHDGQSLVQNDILGNSIIEVVYDGTAWRLNGLVSSQALSGDGAQSVTSASTVTLNNTSLRVQAIAITTPNKSVVLPDARTLTNGGPRFVIANTGTHTFALRSSAETELANGDFANTSGWTLGSGWSIGSGVATKTAGAASDLSQSLSTTNGVFYIVTYTITSISSGGVRCGFIGGGPDVLGTIRTAPGTFAETLCSKGNSTFVLRADSSFAGSIDNVSVTLAHPRLLAAVPPGAVAEAFVVNNTTPPGEWQVSGRNLEPAFVLHEQQFNNFELSVNSVFCKLDDSRVMRFMYGSGSHPFAYVVDTSTSPPTVGSPTLINANTQIVINAILISDNKVLVVTSHTVTNVYHITVSGVACSVSTGATASVFAGGNPFFASPPVVARLGANNEIFVAIRRVTNNIQVQAIDTSGTAPVAGTEQTLGSLPQAVTASTVGIWRVNNTNAVAFYVDDSGTPGSPYSIRSVVISVSGTAITVHTSTGINDVIEDGDMRCFYGQISLTSYLMVYGQGTDLRAVVATVSGASVSLGSPVLVDSFASNVRILSTGIANIRFAQPLVKLDSNRFAVFYFNSDTNNNARGKCVILTISGSSITVGTPLTPNITFDDVLAVTSETGAVFSRRNNLFSTNIRSGIVCLTFDGTNIVVSNALHQDGMPAQNHQNMFSLASGILAIPTYYSTDNPNANSQKYYHELYMLKNNRLSRRGRIFIDEIDLQFNFGAVEVLKNQVAILGRSYQSMPNTNVPRLVLLELVE